MKFLDDVPAIQRAMRMREKSATDHDVLRSSVAREFRDVFKSVMRFQHSPDILVRSSLRDVDNVSCIQICQDRNWLPFAEYFVVVIHT